MEIKEDFHYRVGGQNDKRKSDKKYKAENGNKNGKIKLDGNEY